MMSIGILTHTRDQDESAGDEYIVVEVRFLVGLRSSKLKQRSLVLKVKKQDVDAYSRGDLDLTAFREKVDIQEY